MSLPLTVEQREWMERVAPSKPRTEFREPTKQATAINYPPPVFTDAEIAWLWPLFQDCNHGSFCFAKSFARTDLSKLTPKGKAIVHEVAFRYRVQIFHHRGHTSKELKKWTLSDFVAAVKASALQPAVQQTDEGRGE